MIDDFPEVQERHRVSGKLILPPYTGQLPSPNAHEQQTTAYANSGQLPFPNPHEQRAKAYPGQFLSSTSSKPTTNHLEKFWYLVRKEPAYRLLLVAVVMVLISSIVFISFASSLFFAPPQSSLPSGPIGATPAGTVDLRPTFAPPHGGQGSTTTSQPPRHATPALTNDPNATAQATTVPGGTLAIQIVGLPPQVPNNTTLPVTVIANQPGVTVRLIVQYNVAPGIFSSGTQTTNGGGTATLSWHIRVISTRTVATARVTAIAQGNGQQATSQTVTVQVVSSGINF